MGPMPGITPINVPIIAPAKHQIMFSQVDATENPSAKESISSII